MLLERDAALEALRDALGRVRSSGDGALVAVAGEAGIGKTSVVRGFVGDLRAAEVWWGMCDNLRAPRPLGPLVDIAAAASPDLLESIERGVPRAMVFTRTLEVLRSRREPVVVVLEDLHWADDATLDLLRFLGRRLTGVPALLVLTYRDDEVGHTHPLRQALGDLPSHVPLTRVRPAPLTPEAVAALAEGTQSDPVELARLTGGNPFFVTEAIAAEGHQIAASVRDAVLARAASLSPEGRAALDAAAIHPHPATVDEVAHLAGTTAGVDECVELGVLVAHATRVGFRHELARLAVEAALPPVRRQSLHRATLALLEGTDDPSRCAHHAAAAADAAAILRHAPLAAEAAARVGSHRSACQHLRTAVKVLDRIPAHEAALLLVRHAQEAHVIGEHEEAVRSLRLAVDRFSDAGDATGRGGAQARLVNPLARLGHTAEAEAASAEALAILLAEPPGPELALALVGEVSLRMLARELDTAAAVGQEAIAFVESHADEARLAQALILVGVAEYMGPDPEGGRARLERGITLARDRGLHDVLALGYMQLGSGSGEVRRYDVAVPALEAGIAVASEHDLDDLGSYMTAWAARCDVALGRWDDAARRAASLVSRPSCTGVTRITALNVLGLLRGRRGDPGAWEALDEALALARESAHLQRMWPVVASRAEVAWLEDRIDDEAGRVDDARQLAARLRYPWAVEELTWWAHVAGAQDLDVGTHTPFGLQVAGRWPDAIAAWDTIGSPYEAAAARASGGKPEDRRAAFGVLTDLGAGPLAGRIIQALQQEGERLPRQPRRATRTNPFGLTPREMEVLALLAEDRTNAEIADALFISAKTVDHHVSSVLAKLTVPSRREAGREARRLGIRGRA